MESTKAVTFYLRMHWKKNQQKQIQIILKIKNGIAFHPKTRNNVSFLKNHDGKQLNQVSWATCSIKISWLKELPYVCLSTLAVQNVLKLVQQAQTGRETSACQKEANMCDQMLHPVDANGGGL